MINVALVLVTDPQRSLEDHAGLPLLKRTVLAAQKGGVEEFIVTAPKNSEEDLKRLFSGDDRICSRINWHGHENGDLPDRLKGTSSEPIMIIKAESVFDSNIVEKMYRPRLDDAAACVAVRNTAGATGPGHHTLKLDGDVVVDCNVPDASFQTAGLMLAKHDAIKALATSVANGHTDLYDLVKGLLGTGKVRTVDVTNELCMEITSQETMRESREKLFDRLGLTTDGPFSVHVSRKLSRVVSSVLVRLPITPNQVTLFGFFMGVVACWFFLQGRYWYSVAGAAVFYASIVLDLSDGEVARLKFMSSRYGGWFDSICDSVVFGGILLSAALAIHRDAHMSNVLAVGAVAAGVVLICSNLDFYLHFLEADREKNQPISTMRIVANEDNFFLSLLGFTVLNKLLLYLWIVAAGTSVYLLVLIWELIVFKPSGRKAA
ncbi:MAG: CDP-alcohol phosphatidyltransferase family protein [Candidatus Brocadiales bacterium]|nr:CDP-alcohol phosphatidyltransferase family protein [Candidatus Bathyanammoxibius amoris]